jgi:hypothetical protein
VILRKQFEHRLQVGALFTAKTEELFEGHSGQFSFLLRRCTGKMVIQHEE